MIRIRSAVLGLAVLAGSATAAAAQQTTPPATERQAPAAGDRKHGKHGGHGRGHAAHQGRGERNLGRRALFRGVDLTDAQKAQVREIHAKYRPKLQAIAQSMRPALADARSAGARGDTAAARTALARATDDRAKVRALMEQEAKEVRAVLTPEQQAKFDENVARLRDRATKPESRSGKKA